MRKQSILFLLWFLLSMPIVFGQDKTGDSLKAVLAKSADDTGKVNTLIALSKLYINSAPELALSYGSQARDAAHKLPFTKGEAYAQKYIGIYYFTQNQYVETLDTWLKSLNLFREIGDKQGISNILNNIGSLYYNQNDEVKALDYHLQALKIAEELGDKMRIASALQNVGNDYLRKKATKQKALQFLLRALPLSIELGNQNDIVVGYTNLGEAYYDLDKTDSSLYYYKKGLVASKNSEAVSTNFILNNIGKAYAKQGNYDLAIQYQKQSVALATKFNAPLYKGESLLGLGNSYYAKGDVKESLEAFHEAEGLLKEVNAAPDLKDTYTGLTKAYSKLGDFKKAFIYQSLVGDLKDTLYNTDADKRTASLQFNFDISKKESQISLLTKDQELKDLDLQKQKTTRNAFAIGFLLILITAFVIYRNYRIKVKTNIILDKQKVQIENLMLNILPAEVATELQEQGRATPRHYESVSVLFTDFKSFTSLSDKMTPQELIEELSESFMAFDDIIERNQLEKIKTIGDSYMCAGGLPTPYESHVFNIVKAGLEMQEYVIDRNSRRAERGLPAWELRVGIHVGPVVAGVVGKKKYAYDIWGSTVNIASRMESNGEPGKVNISAGTYALIKSNYTCSYRGKISAKNVGEIDMYFVEQEIIQPSIYSVVPQQADNDDLANPVIAFS